MRGRREEGGGEAWWDDGDGTMMVGEEACVADGDEDVGDGWMMKIDGEGEEEDAWRLLRGAVKRRGADAVSDDKRGWRLYVVRGEEENGLMCV